MLDEEQQETQTSLSFEIENDQMRLKNARPSHLERRWTAVNHPSPFSPTAMYRRAEDNRQALMAERKAKLADHLGHVNGVCDKHKALLLQQRSRRNTLLNDALSGAERNRQKLVTERRSQSGKAYYHAKEVAQSQFRRMQIDTQRRRQELDHKLQSSRWRRQQMLRIGKSKLKDGAAIENLLRVHAAQAIQNWWRRLYLLKFVLAWKRLDFSLASLSALPFQQATEKVQTPIVIKTAGRLLMRLKKVTPADMPSPNLGKTPARVFLSSFMLLTHTGVLMENLNGQPETDLLSAARTMVMSFDTLIQTFDEQLSLPFIDEQTRSLHLTDSTKLSSLHRSILSFLQHWYQYYSTFDAYKQHDTKLITSNLIENYLQLARLLRNLLPASATLTRENESTTTSDIEYQLNIEKQMDRFRVHLRSLGGDDAIRQLEVAIEHEANATMTESEHQPSTTPIPIEFQSLRNTNNTSSAVPIIIDSDSPPNDISNRSVQETLMTLPATLTPLFNEQSTKTHMETPKLTSSTIASVKHDVDLIPNTDQSMVPPAPAGILGLNDQLAHELIMDPNFCLADSDVPKAINFGGIDMTGTQLARRVKQAARRVFFDRVKELAARREFLPWLPDIIGEVRDMLLGLIVNKGQTSMLIAEVLDPQFIAQQICANAFDLDGCLKNVVNFMLQLAMPARDPEIRALTSLPSIEEVLLRILELLETMKLDLANYNLNSLRAYLITHAVEYETQKFSELIKSLPSTSAALSRTHAWLAVEVQRTMQLTLGENTDLVQKPFPRYEDIYNDALLALLFDNTPVSLVTIPEILALDTLRLFKLQNDLQALCIIAPLVMLTKNAVPQLRNPSTATDKLVSRLYALLDPVSRNTTMGSPVTSPSLSSLASVIVDTANEMLRTHSETVNSTAMSTVDSTVLMTSSNDEEHTNTFALSPQQEQLVAQLVNRTVHQRDAVYSLTQRRVQAILKQRMSMDNTTVRSSVVSTLSTTTTINSTTTDSPLNLAPSLASSGLDCVKSQIDAIGQRIMILTRHNKAVHAKWVDDIIKTELNKYIV